jgi:hypothetical protein
MCSISHASMKAVTFKWHYLRWKYKYHSVLWILTYLVVEGYGEILIWGQNITGLVSEKKIKCSQNMFSLET